MLLGDTRVPCRHASFEPQGEKSRLVSAANGAFGSFLAETLCELRLLRSRLACSSLKRCLSELKALPARVFFAETLSVRAEGSTVPVRLVAAASFEPPGGEISVRECQPFGLLANEVIAFLGGKAAIGPLASAGLFEARPVCEYGYLRLRKN